MTPQRPIYTPPGYRTWTGPEEWQRDILRSHYPRGGYPKTRHRKYVTGALTIIFLAALAIIAISRGAIQAIGG